VRPAARDATADQPIPPSRLRLGDLLDEVTLSIMHKPARSLLTVLGTVLGVATLICTLGLTSTAASQVSARFDALEATKVVVKDADPANVELPFPALNVERLRRTPGVLAAGESWTLPGLPVRTMERADPLRPPASLTVVAIEPATLLAVDARIGAGRGFDPFDVSRSEPVVLIGSGAAAQLGIGTMTADRTVMIGSMHLLIAGIVTEAPRRPELLSTAMVVPGVGKTLLGALGPTAADPEREVTIKVRPGAAQVIGTAVPNILGPQAPQRYKVETPPSADQFRAQVQGDLGSVFLILGIVALTVGVLGIANSGLVAVMQRTREFGVRRALGARARHIAWQVLCEAGVLGLMGGLAGLTVGLVVVVVTAAEKGWTPALDPVVTAVAPLLGLATGVIAGLYPAWRASRIEPVEALRA
jgi:putative ABC transport system permease protein